VWVNAADMGSWTVNASENQSSSNVSLYTN
jgi:hypothetical protein